MHVPGRSECELKSTKVVGARGPYYRRTRPRHGTQVDDIEASLAHVESKAAPALRQIVADEPLTVERKGALAQLFGLQMMRGPAFFAKHEEIHRSVLEGGRRAISSRGISPPSAAMSSVPAVRSLRLSSVPRIDL